ncbi:MAG: alpha-glucosidase [Paenibacillaceae bacterium]|jgi:alpha-D-xyloside xylohydrolase|nr:alpha-glucosidase [Paenibacillaceae bacterium]
MKFTDGYWHVREGLNVHCPVEIRDVKVEANSIAVYASTKKIIRKGDTLNTPLLTARYSSPLKDILCVELIHHGGKRRKGPDFVLNAPGAAVAITEEEDGIRLASGKLEVWINKKNGWSIDYCYGDKRLTGSGYKGPAFIKKQDGSAFMREQLDLSVGEYVYGLGERFTPFVKNGQSVDLWNEDGGTCSEQAYKNISFYLSNRGYGVFVDHPERVSYEIASENVSKAQFSVPGEQLRYYIIGGETLKDVLGNYTALTGRPALPPAWTFGLWLTTSFTTDYNEETVNSFIDGMISRGVPLHVFHFDCFWMKEFQWCDFKWDTDAFPDPEGMLKRLKSKGLKICVWINSYIAEKSCLFEEGMERGYLVRTRDGDVWQWDRWQAGMGLVDFTNPEAVRWYKEKLRALVEMGVDCFKTDFGERIPTDVVYYDGSDPVKMHNYYTFLYNKAVFEVLEETLGYRQAAVFARSATAGSQQFPVHWGGDCSASYPSMAETLRGGLSLGLCGFGFWSHDISGFESTATPDLYKRWTAFGLLSTHSRLHGSSSYRVPWLFDEEAVEVLSRFTKLKCSLMPYLFAASCEAAACGLPVMRAMVLEFPEDPACAVLDCQYMLGDNLLVAPIFNEEGLSHYYLPQAGGRWTHLLTGESAEGGHWRSERYDYFGLPLWVRPGSMIAIGATDNRPDYDYADHVTLHLFELADGAAAAARICGLDGEEELTVHANRSGDILVIRVETAGGLPAAADAGHTARSPKPWSVIVRGIHGWAQVEGAEITDRPEGILLVPDPAASAVTVRL